MINYTDQEIKQREELKKLMNKPKQVGDIDFDFHILRNLCQIYLDSIGDGHGCDDNDAESHIIEYTMEAIFGEDVYKWINKQLG